MPRACSASGDLGGASVSLFALVPKRSWLMAIAAVCAGLLGGACSAGLIALINTALNDDRSRNLIVVGFCGLVVARTAANGVARLLLNYFTQQTLADLCRSLSRRVLATPLWQLERV